MPNKILVTGAGGLIGGEALRFLLGQGFDAAGVYRQKPAIPVAWPGTRVDLATEPLSSTVKDHYDFIVHSAAQLPRNADQFETVAEVNQKMDNNVLRFAEECGARIIYLSGTSVYGLCGGICTEDSPVDPPNEYVKEKSIFEQKFLQKTNATILRVSSPYSRKQVTPTVLKIFIERAMRNQPIRYHGSGERQQDFIAIEDVSKAIHASIINPSNGIFNIAAGQSISMKELAELIVATRSGCKSIVEPSGQADEQENYRPQISIEKARQLLGWNPVVSLQEGIQQWIGELQNENRNLI